MFIIPAINCKDYETALSRIKVADKILSPDYPWVHIDVVDGIFAPVVTWGNPEDLKKLNSQFQNIKFEIHLMVDDHEHVAKSWLDAGAKRLIIQVESAGDAEATRKLANEMGAEIVLSGGPTVTAEKLIERAKNFEFVQVLTVNPGFAGQEFGKDAIEKIFSLRQSMPNVILELDGGVNSETAKLGKDAGADILISASYIFSAPDPKEAYEELRSL